MLMLLLLLLLLLFIAQKAESEKTMSSGSLKGFHRARQKSPEESPKPFLPQGRVLEPFPLEGTVPLRKAVIPLQGHLLLRNRSFLML